MADQNEEVLRRSLDAVDRHRNRLLIAVVVTAFALLFAFVSASRAAHSSNPNVFLHAVMIILVVWTTMMTLVVVIQITAMTRRILRAIDLASRK